MTLLELANGYRALANGGVWRPWRWRAAAPGEPAEPGRRWSRPRAAALVLDILADPVARIPGFGVETPLDFPFPVAAKTGTSRHFTDNWAVGVDGRLHGGGVGRQLQRPADGRRERRERRGAAAPSRRAGYGAPPRAGRAAHAGRRPARCR